MKLFLLLCCGAFWAVSAIEHKQEYWGKIVEKLEKMGGPQGKGPGGCYPYTAGSCLPESLAGKVASHEPKLHQSHNDKVTLWVEHPTSGDHFIGFLFAKNQDGTILHLHQYRHPGDDSEERKQVFHLPYGTTEVTGYAYCNLHGLWATHPVSVSPGEL